MATTATEILSKFGLASAVKDADQFLIGVAGTEGSLTLAKVAATIVRAYLRGDITTADVSGTLSGETATLEAIIADIYSRLLSTVDRSAFNRMSDIVNSLMEHSGLIYFDGFADGELIAGISYTDSDYKAILYDRFNKQFVLEMPSPVETVGGTTPYCNWWPGASDYMKKEGEMWPLKVYRCRQDGVSYMYDGDTLVPLTIPDFIEQTDPEADILPGPLNIWGEVDHISVQARGLIPTALKTIFAQYGAHPGPQEYRLQFTVASDSFTFDPGTTCAWVDGDEPEWTQGWTYQVSIEDGLAVAAGWPPAEE